MRNSRRGRRREWVVGLGVPAAIAISCALSSRWLVGLAPRSIHVAMVAGSTALVALGVLCNGLGLLEAYKAWLATLPQSVRVRLRPYVPGVPRRLPIVELGMLLVLLLPVVQIAMGVRAAAALQAGIGLPWFIVVLWGGGTLVGLALMLPLLLLWAIVTALLGPRRG
jgi:hypothetical protein